MQNLQLFFNSLEKKISTLEVKERERLETQAQKDREKYPQIKLEDQQRRIEKDIFFWKLSIKFKLFQSLSKFITKEDRIENINLLNGVKGLEIDCKVRREGREYDFLTTTIEAGGYNIQCFHFRYIVTTKLPKVENKYLLKVFKFQEELERLVFQFEQYKQTPLTVNSYSTREWQEKSRQNNIENYKKRINILQQKINNLNTNSNENK